MRLYLLLALFAAIFAVAGFLAMAIAWAGFVCWLIALVLILCSWAAYRARERARGHKDAPPNLPTG
ncbi:MAG TPA: hypothetical protein VFE31_11425 [Opitutaceae bacterium]|jgi:membrane protein implicated in regulation of membrane protease activity|nr:hypothetical protein [Opitutaceae bacterium]